MPAGYQFRTATTWAAGRAPSALAVTICGKVQVGSLAVTEPPPFGHLIPRNLPAFADSMPFAPGNATIDDPLFA
jgi:hypothetical protein